MKFFIKIDRRTIKKNPNAGSTMTYIPTDQTCTFKYDGNKLPDYLVDGKNCHITNWNIESISGTLIYPIEKYLFQKIMEDEKLITLEIEQGIQEIEHLPEPEYFYKYKKTKVKCNECGSEFCHDQLEADSCMDAYSNTICPVCGMWECCDIEYENI